MRPPLSFRRLAWRWVLSTLQVLLATTLLIAGHIEKAKHDTQVKGQSPDKIWRTIEYDYIPQASSLLIIIDFPVVVVCAPFAAVIKSNLLTRVCFIALVGVFWYWIGLGLERGSKERETPPKSHAKSRLAINAIGLGISGTLLISILSSGSGAMALLMYMAIIGWCAGFAAYFAVKVARGLGFKRV